MNGSFFGHSCFPACAPPARGPSSRGPAHPLTGRLDHLQRGAPPAPAPPPACPHHHSSLSHPLSAAYTPAQHTPSALGTHRLSRPPGKPHPPNRLADWPLRLRVARLFRHHAHKSGKTMYAIHSNTDAQNNTQSTIRPPTPQPTPTNPGQHPATSPGLIAARAVAARLSNSKPGPARRAELHAINGAARLAYYISPLYCCRSSVVPKSAPRPNTQTTRQPHRNTTPTPPPIPHRTGGRAVTVTKVTSPAAANGTRARATEGPSYPHASEVGRRGAPFWKGCAPRPSGGAGRLAPGHAAGGHGRPTPGPHARRPRRASASPTTATQ